MESGNVGEVSTTEKDFNQNVIFGLLPSTLRIIIACYYISQGYDFSKLILVYH